MKKHTLQSTALMLALSLSCTGCGLLHKNDKEDKASETETTAEAEPGSEVEAEETAKESKEAKEPEDKTAEADVVRAFHPNIQTERTEGSVSGEGYTYISYWLQTGGVALNDEEAREYPELNRALADAFASLKTSTEPVLDDLRDTAVDLQEYTNYNTEFMVKYTPQVVRADSRVLSYELFYEDYYGGAHGYESCDPRTFDSKTGKELSFYDVITDETVARNAIVDALRKQCADSDGLIENNTPEDDAKTFFEDLNSAEYSGSVAWTLGTDRLNIYYNPYSIGSFSMGIMQVTLLFDEYPDVVKPEYQKAPSGYAVHFEYYSDYMADIYNNGTLTNISVGYEGGQDYYHDAIKIELQGANGQTTSRVFDDMYYFELDPYYVKQDNRHFLHIFESSEDDWVADHVYEITNGQIEDRGEVAGRPVELDSSYYSQGELSKSTHMAAAYTDPQNLYLSRGLDAFSTYSATRHYFVGENGSLESAEPYLAGNTETAPVVKTELTVKMTDSAGKETGKTEVLPAGTVLHFYMTDNESYVVFRYGDGKYGKVSMDNSDWPQKINGQELESVLDGTMFAG